MQKAICPYSSLISENELESVERVKHGEAK